MVALVSASESSILEIRDLTTAKGNKGRGNESYKPFNGVFESYCLLIPINCSVVQWNPS